MSEKPSIFTGPEPSTEEMLAILCHRIGVPVPGPATGMELLHVVQHLSRLIGQVDDRRAAAVLEMYRDGLLFVVGVWSQQQKLTIESLEKLVSDSRSGGAA